MCRPYRTSINVSYSAKESNPPGEDHGSAKYFSSTFTPHPRRVPAVNLPERPPSTGLLEVDAGTFTKKESQARASAASLPVTIRGGTRPIPYPRFSFNRELRRFSYLPEIETGYGSPPSFEHGSFERLNQVAPQFISHDMPAIYLTHGQSRRSNCFLLLLFGALKKFFCGQIRKEEKFSDRRQRVAITKD